MNDCIFCKIVAEEIPSNKLFENDKLIAFLDIKPINPGHTLVVSKAHTVNLLDTHDEVLKDMIVTTKKLAKVIQETVSAEGFNILINNNKIAGQAVPHIHFHIIPRFKKDGRKLWSGAEYSPGEAEKIESRIKELL